MAYIVEQKNKGRIYLYKVESYWDKDKKQARQKRTYIGPKENKNTIKSKPNRNGLLSKSYGDVFLLDHLSEEIGLKETLKNVFPDLYKDIITIAFYEIIEGAPLYLYPFWHKEHFLPDTKPHESSALSVICETLGTSQQQIMEFFIKWIEHLSPIGSIYYDITSISSYSTNIDFVEWGYNRDGEDLPQINLGVVCCGNNSLPVFYRKHPGSIVDVTTIKNSLKYFKHLNLNDALLIMDRGFFSKKNILEMTKDEGGIQFIQPLPFSLKKVKEIIKRSKKQMQNPLSVFKYDQEILYYNYEDIEFEKEKFHGHIYFNEKADVEGKHRFYSTLCEIEETLKLSERTFERLKDYIRFKQNNIHEKYSEYFKWNKTTLKIERNSKKIKNHLNNIGSFILMTNKPEMEKREVLEHYRNKDRIEKLFLITKKEIDGKRLRAHSNYNNDGRIFLNFISLIIYSKLLKIMKEKKLLEKYSVKELLYELKKIKITEINKEERIIGEVTKKQRIILQNLGVQDLKPH